MFRYSGLIQIRFFEPIDVYIRKVRDTIEIIQVSATDACSEVLLHDADLERLPDYIRCSVIHDFGGAVKQPKSVSIEIAETLVLIDGDVCNQATLPDVYVVDDDAS